MSTLDEMEMPTLTFDPAPEPEEKAPGSSGTGRKSKTG